MALRLAISENLKQKGVGVSEFKTGDIVVLTAGSMRMAVESAEKNKVAEKGWGDLF